MRRDGDRVLLDVSMVDGESGAEQWTREFDVERSRLRETIGDISGSLAKTLFLELATSVGERIARLKPDEVEADDLAMKGCSVYLKASAPTASTRRASCSSRRWRRTRTRCARCPA